MKRLWLALLLWLMAMPLEAATPTSLDVTWDAPTTNADGTPLTNLAGYRIYVGACKGSQFTSVGNVTAYTLTGLTPSTSYTVWVTALNTSGNESVCSGSATGMTAVGSTTLPATSVALVFDQEVTQPPLPSGWPVVTFGTPGSTTVQMTITWAASPTPGVTYNLVGDASGAMINVMTTATSFSKIVNRGATGWACVSARIGAQSSESNCNSITAP